MKRLTFSAVVIAVVLLVTTVSCTAVRYSDGYDNGYNPSVSFYGSIDPFTGFYYNTVPYGYYSGPYVNRYYGGRGYYSSKPFNNGHARNWYNNNQPRNWNSGTRQRTWNSAGQQQNRNESRTRVFGNHSR